MCPTLTYRALLLLQVRPLVLRARGGRSDERQQAVSLRNGSHRRARVRRRLRGVGHLHLQPARHVRGAVPARHGALGLGRPPARPVSPPPSLLFMSEPYCLCVCVRACRCRSRRSCSRCSRRVCWPPWTAMPSADGAPSCTSCTGPIVSCRVVSFLSFNHHSPSQHLLPLCVYLSFCVCVSVCESVALRIEERRTAC